jgi:hypothetical protein
MVEAESWKANWKWWKEAVVAGLWHFPGNWFEGRRITRKIHSRDSMCIGWIWPEPFRNASRMLYRYASLVLQPACQQFLPHLLGRVPVSSLPQHVKIHRSCILPGSQWRDFCMSDRCTLLRHHRLYFSLYTCASTAVSSYSLRDMSFLVI